jgi:hypothetical protein
VCSGQGLGDGVGRGENGGGASRAINGGDISMDKHEFGWLVDQTGLRLTDEQKSVLFEVYPMFQEMVTRATPPLPREAEPSTIFVPEVR